METTAHFEGATTRKIFLRLPPYLFLLCLIAFLDRTNVSLAIETIGGTSYEDHQCRCV